MFALPTCILSCFARAVEIAVLVHSTGTPQKRVIALSPVSFFLLFMHSDVSSLKCFLEERSGSVGLISKSQSMAGSSSSTVRTHKGQYALLNIHLSYSVADSPLNTVLNSKVRHRIHQLIRLARHVTAQTRLTTHGTVDLDEADESGCSRMPRTIQDHFKVHPGEFVWGLHILQSGSSFEITTADFMIIAGADVVLDRRDTASGKICSVFWETGFASIRGIRHRRFH